jgi:hypothetical protein
MIDRSAGTICGISGYLLKKFNKLSAQVALGEMAPEFAQRVTGQFAVKVRGQGVGAGVFGLWKFS